MNVWGSRRGCRRSTRGPPGSESFSPVMAKPSVHIYTSSVPVLIPSVSKAGSRQVALLTSPLAGPGRNALSFSFSEGGDPFIRDSHSTASRSSVRSLQMYMCYYFFWSICKGFTLFFSSSAHRWAVLVQENSRLTSLSVTRWSRRADATNALIKIIDGIYKALSVLANDQAKKLDTRHEASSLLTNIIKLENVFMVVLWHRILSRFNVVSIYLQKVEVDLNTANNMLLSLVAFIRKLRPEFSKMENESKELSSFVVQEYSNFGKRTIIKKFRDGEKEIPKLHGSDKFRVETFLFNNR